MARGVQRRRLVPIGALVVALERGLRARAIRTLRADPSLTLGAPVGDRLPIVTETASLEAGADRIAEIARVPGVLRVDLVSVDFSDLDLDAGLDVDIARLHAKRGVSGGGGPDGPA